MLEYMEISESNKVNYSRVQIKPSFLFPPFSVNEEDFAGEFVLLARVPTFVILCLKIVQLNSQTF